MLGSEAQTELISQCSSVTPNQRKAYISCQSGFYADFHKENTHLETKQVSTGKVSIVFVVTTFLLQMITFFTA